MELLPTDHMATTDRQTEPSPAACMESMRRQMETMQHQMQTIVTQLETMQSRLDSLATKLDTGTRLNELEKTVQKLDGSLQYEHTRISRMRRRNYS